MTPCLLLALVLASPVRAETGYDAWLRYDRLDQKTVDERYANFPAVIVAMGDSEVIASARDELIRGVNGMLGHRLRIESELPKENAILLATFEEAKRALPSLEKMPKLADDGFWLKSIQVDGQRRLLITAPNERGVLYGAFALLRKIALTQPITKLNERQVPAAPLRTIIHWDYLDGTVAGVLDPADFESGKRQRGLPIGQSIFWNAGQATDDVDRLRDYARLLASVGINGVSINDPSAGPHLLRPAYRRELAKIDEVLRPWGVRLFIALNSPDAPGATFARAGRDWPRLAKEIYADLPGLAGLILDADWAAGAARADAINAIAAAIRPHGGVLICRTCVCGSERGAGSGEQGARGTERAVLSENGGSTLHAPGSPPAPHDPAKTAYELFQPLDGLLDENVVLQIKHGPMDFQVREPPSPLFGALEKTSQAIELQLTQRHLGQQRHLCFLVPKWKQALEYNMHALHADAEKPAAEPTPVKELVTGKTFGLPLGGFTAVSNARRTTGWLGHDLALANLYGFGRLAWDPNLNGKTIADEWTRLTFGHDPLVVGTLVDMLLKSWRIYENYTGPLGAGTLTDVANSRYGPAIESTVSTGWTPWHSADSTGIGKDRTTATGSGFIGQYRPPLTQRFESLENCPDELLLFMHRVPYTHVLRSGKTVIQHIYDSHYQGARDAARLVQQWEALQGRVDEERHQAVLDRLVYQAGHAQLWRDAVCIWFLQRSGIADNEGRVGNYPNRFEAEAMQLEGFATINVTPWETASGGQAVWIVDPSGRGAVSMTYEGPAGWFDVNLRYFDENDGAAGFRLLVAGQAIDEWTADDLLPASRPNGDTSTRRLVRRVALRPGDEIRIEATAHAGERATIDYLEIDPAAK